MKSFYRRIRNECSFKFAWPNITSSINLMSTENKRKQLRIAKFIYIAFKKKRKKHCTNKELIIFEIIFIVSIK